MKAQIHGSEEQNIPSSKHRQDYSHLKTGREDLSQATQMNQDASKKDYTQQVKHKPILVAKKPGRNERVKVLNLQNGETKEMKYKQAEPLINSGSWQMVD